MMPMTHTPPIIRAMIFDIQGTAVDFHAPLMRMGATIDAAKGLDVDWAAFSVGWRRLYREAMDAVIEGRRAWIRVDRIYREALDTLLAQHGLASVFSSAERDEIATIWTRLEPWPDSVEGLTRLRRPFTLATLSNAGMAAIVAVVKHAGLPFDAVLSAELVKSYKPAPSVYGLAVDYLGFAPREIMLVACHKYDLHAARALGFRTAFVARPLEFGPDERPDIDPDPCFDINAADFLDLAAQLGA